MLNQPRFLIQGKASCWRKTPAPSGAGCVVAPAFALYTLLSVRLPFQFTQRTPQTFISKWSASHFHWSCASHWKNDWTPFIIAIYLSLLTLMNNAHPGHQWQIPWCVVAMRRAGWRKGRRRKYCKARSVLDAVKYRSEFHRRIFRRDPPVELSGNDPAADPTWPLSVWFNFCSSSVSQLMIRICYILGLSEKLPARQMVICFQWKPNFYYPRLPTVYGYVVK